ncbi:MAG: 1-acyl-sn-glycerol-3-phosphate acyltransferase [Flavobacteriia bacterium]|nr:1-acyl-sn-glycerol-3-phosphate acyltransferase [Flavobacteriia bacterium]
MMRFFYFLLFFTLRISMPFYYKRRAKNNPPKGFYGRTIYVSNHAASFMDPLVVATSFRPIVFFMTRSDVFKGFLKPVLWASHMLPIYRQLDGDDTKGKNEAVFKRCSRILSFGRNLLIFGEGFTDDVFIRRLKPIKKGAVRIGFMALEDMNWKKKVYIAAIGCNYTEPSQMQSEILVSASNKICLNDYKEEYANNPNLVINSLTKQIEKLMQEQITHVANKDWAPFHENIMILTRKGMNADSHDDSISLKKRWEYSRKLALWMNGIDLENKEQLVKLKKDLEGYFSLLKRFKLKENYVYDAFSKVSRRKELLFLLLLWPLAILGALHGIIPYLITKKFAEKTFKRRVFWSSVKMMMGKLVWGILNIPAIFIFYHVIYPSYWLGFTYYLCVAPFFSLIAYKYMLNYQTFKRKGIVGKMDLTKIISKRSELIVRIHELVEEA